MTKQQQIGKQRGTVALWRGSYGFIKPLTGGGQDLFVHYTDIEMAGFRKLEAEQLVEFEVLRYGDGKTKAFNVRVI